MHSSWFFSSVLIVQVNDLRATPLRGSRAETKPALYPYLFWLVVIWHCLVRLYCPVLVMRRYLSCFYLQGWIVSRLTLLTAFSVSD